GGRRRSVPRDRAHRVGRHALPAGHRAPRPGARAMTAAKPRGAGLEGSDSGREPKSAARQRVGGIGGVGDGDGRWAARAPARVAEYVSGAAARGIAVCIAGAGAAARLAGVVAAHTTLPVIGVPLNATSLNGLDALLATVQMPAGVPVATVAVGGADNAGIL